jgi:hypothetical protein
VKPGNLQTYHLDLTGVRDLTFRTEDAGDGRSSDWALWLEPVMER